jgi:hypothetical protein
LRPSPRRRPASGIVYTSRSRLCAKFPLQ